MAFRMFLGVLSINGVDSFQQDWAKDIWYTSLGIFVPLTNFCEVLTYCIMIIAMSKPCMNHLLDDDQAGNNGKDEYYTFETLGKPEEGFITYEEA